jgi:hypothetical protein
MDDDANVETKDAIEPADISEMEDRVVRRRVARALWSIDSPAASGDAETRRAAYAEERLAYLKKARRLIRQLEKRGVSVSMVPAEADEPDEDQD